jgi:ABC-type transporter Mla subunit MlaD
VATNTDAALRSFDKATKDIDAFLGSLPEIAATVTEDPDAGGEDA